MTATKYTHKLTPPRVASMLLSSLAVAACAQVRYPSLGIDGINAENALFVSSRVLHFETELANLARDTWTQALQVSVLGVQPECGTATYEVQAQQEGAEPSASPIAANGVVTVNRFDCESGEHSETMSITFKEGAYGGEPTAESFRARVEYFGVREQGITVDAAFDMTFFSPTDPLAEDFDGASWQIVPATDGWFKLVGPSEEQASVESFRCQYGEVRNELGVMELYGCDLVFRDGTAATPLTVYTPTFFKRKITEDGLQRPYEGVLRLRDVDSMETRLNVSKLYGGVMELKTYSLLDSGNPEYANVTWDDIDSVQGPSGAWL